MLAGNDDFLNFFFEGSRLRARWDVVHCFELWRVTEGSKMGYFVEFVHFFLTRGGTLKIFKVCLEGMQESNLLLKVLE